MRFTEDALSDSGGALSAARCRAGVRQFACRLQAICRKVALGLRTGPEALFVATVTRLGSCSNTGSAARAPSGCTGAPEEARGAAEKRGEDPRMAETISTVPPRHQSGGLAVALAKLDLDALTVSDAVADVAGMAGENVTTALRADFEELRAEVNARIGETNARIDTVAGAVQSLQREIGTLRWMIGVGFTLLSVLVGLATLFLRFSGTAVS